MLPKLETRLRFARKDHKFPIFANDWRKDTGRTDKNR